MQEDFFDPRALFKILFRRWWVVLGAGVAAGIIAFVTFAPPSLVYLSTVKMFVQGGSDGVGISVSDIDEGRRLSQLYGDLATTRPILDAIAADDDVPYTGSELRDKIRIDDTRSFIEISATDADPLIASTIANVAALTLIDELSKRQITQVAQFQDSLSQLGIDGEIAIVAAQVAKLPVLSIAEQAVPAVSPVNTADARINRVQLGAAIGILLGIALVLGLSVLDDTVKTEDQLAVATGLVTLGTVPDYSQAENGSPILLNGDGRHHPASEAYYIIRANIDYVFESDNSIRSILITGPGPGEGKSTLSSNLAVAFAKEGKSVILVDADLRKPVQHQMFSIDMTEKVGIREILNGDATVEDTLVDTEVDGLRVITAGNSAGDPSLMLRGMPLNDLKKRLMELADVVVYDSPPVLIVSDPLLIGEDVDLTIMVSESGSTSRHSARRGAEALSRPGHGAVSTVLTKQRTGFTGYGYGNYGYSSYYGNGRDERGVLTRGKGAARKLASRAVFWKNGRHPDA